MKRSLLFSLVICGSALLQQGCTVHWVVKNTEPTPAATVVPFPNAFHIEGRVKNQIQRLKDAMRSGNLDQETAYLLGQNDEMIRQFANEYRGPGQTVDLNYQQTADLDNMLDDNSQFIEDAIQNHQSWANYFQIENYDYTVYASPYLYLTYLDHQLRAQQAKIDSAVKSGRLTDAQGQELSNRINVIKTAKRNYYRENGHVDLSEDQVRQLSQMAQDNSQYLRFRLQGSHGRWNKDKFTSWTQQNHKGFGQNNGNHWGRRDNRQNQVPTPVPTAVPTQPAVMNDHSGNHWGIGKDKQDHSNPAPTQEAVATSVPTEQPQVVVQKAPVLKLIPPGQLVQFLKHADQAVQMATKLNRLDESQLANINQKLQAIHQKADEDLNKNQANSVTQEQMAELAKMNGAMNQMIQSNMVHGRGKQGSQGKNKQNDQKKDKKVQGKNEEKKNKEDKVDKKADTPAPDNSDAAKTDDKKDNGQDGDKKDKGEKKEGSSVSEDKKFDTPAADNSDSTKTDDKKDNGQNGDKKDDKDKKDKDNNGNGNNQP